MRNEFTVIIPVYNSEKFIERTLNSLIIQTILPSEIIIIDDGSSDNTVDVINKYFYKKKQPLSTIVKLFYQDHKGPGAARNRGINEAKSNWICFLDSDDLWSKNKLKKLNKYINDNKNCNFFCNYENVYNLNGTNYVLEYGKYFNKLTFYNDLYYKNMFSTSAITAKRSIFINYGKFDESLMSAQDYDLWLRIAPYIKPFFIKEILGCYVIRKGNITSGKLIGRFLNEILIAHRYSKDVTRLLYIRKIFRIIAAYIFYYLQRIVYDK